MWTSNATYATLARDKPGKGKRQGTNYGMGDSILKRGGGDARGEPGRERSEESGRVTEHRWRRPDTAGDVESVFGGV